MESARSSGGSELQVGGRLGPYRLEEILGEGGMGIVFRAVRDTDGEEVALKVLKRVFVEDETFRRRFVHEGRAAQEVEHRHLVPILEAGEIEGRQYLAVAYIRGRSLADRVKDEGRSKSTSRSTSLPGSARDSTPSTSSASSTGT